MILPLHILALSWVIAGMECTVEKQSRLDDRRFDGTKPVDTGVDPRPLKKKKPAKSIEINYDQLKENMLWDILVEVARNNPMYAGLTGYIRAEVLPKYPTIGPRELASMLSIPLGEAIVILDDARAE